VPEQEARDCQPQPPLRYRGKKVIQQIKTYNNEKLLRGACAQKLLFKWGFWVSKREALVGSGKGAIQQEMVPLII